MIRKVFTILKFDKAIHNCKIESHPYESIKFPPFCIIFSIDLNIFGFKR